MNRVNNLAGRTKKKLPSNLKSNKSKRNAFMSSLYPSKRSKSNIKSPSALRELILKKVKEGPQAGILIVHSYNCSLRSPVILTIRSENCSPCSHVIELSLVDFCF